MRHSKKPPKGFECPCKVVLRIIAVALLYGVSFKKIKLKRNKIIIYPVKTPNVKQNIFWDV
jgi:hypothetical protein